MHFRHEVPMKPHRMVRFSIAAAALSCIVATPAVARSAYDGTWSVVIITDRGECDRAYRYSVNVRNGFVTYGGDLSVNLSGRVANNGRVNVRVSSGNQYASGSGRLSSNYGGGTWRGQGSLGVCAGRWTAERR
jgi:hypothetical protein